MKNKEQMNKINSKMVGLNPTIPVIPFNVNEANKFLKITRLNKLKTHNYVLSTTGSL